MQVQTYAYIFMYINRYIDVISYQQQMASYSAYLTPYLSMWIFRKIFLHDSNKYIHIPVPYKTIQKTFTHLYCMISIAVSKHNDTRVITIYVLCMVVIHVIVEFSSVF